MVWFDMTWCDVMSCILFIDSLALSPGTYVDQRLIDTGSSVQFRGKGVGRRIRIGGTFLESLKHIYLSIWTCTVLYIVQVLSTLMIQIHTDADIGGGSGIPSRQ